jgi:hypothetical protein
MPEYHSLTGCQEEINSTRKACRLGAQGGQGFDSLPRQAVPSSNTRPVRINLILPSQMGNSYRDGPLPCARSVQPHFNVAGFGAVITVAHTVKAMCRVLVVAHPDRNIPKWFVIARRAGIDILTVGPAAFRAVHVIAQGFKLLGYSVRSVGNQASH